MLNDELKLEERLYFFSVKEWSRELEYDFNYFRSLSHSDVARRAVNVLGKYEQVQLQPLSKALAKRSVFDSVLERCFESITEDENDLIETFLKHIQDECWKEASQLSPDANENSFKIKLNKRLLKKAVISKLTPILGDNYQKSGSGEIYYYTPVVDNVIITHIDFGGQSYSLSYSHSIINNHGKIFAEQLSFLRWMGISGGETEWNILSNDEIEPTSTILAKLCSHFISEVPKLLDGLSLS